MSTTSQNKRILKHLESGKTLTAIQALNKFGCFRLAARIKNLKDRGHKINGQMIYTQSNKYKKYWLQELKS